MVWLIGSAILATAVLVACGWAGRRGKQEPLPLLASPTWPGAWAGGAADAHRGAQLTAPMAVPPPPQTPLPEGVHLRVVGNDDGLINECIFDEIVAGLNKIPPLPQAILLILRELENMGSSARSVAEIVGTEPVLAATLLRVCNSAALGLRQQIVRVDQAVAYLGYSVVKSLVFRAKLAQILPGRGGQGYDAEKLWLHSLAVGQLAENLARRIGGVDPAMALTIGLLHDIGKLAINSQFPRIVARLLEEGPGDESFLARERRLFGADHAHIGGFLAERWKLPEELVQAIRLHHVAHPDAVAGVSSELLLAIHVVLVANQLAKYGCVYCADMEIDIVPDAVLDGLGLPAVETLLEGDVRQVIERCAAFAGPVAAMAA